MLSDVIDAVRRKDFTNLNCLLQYGIVDTPEDSLESASQIQTTKSVIDHLIDDNKNSFQTKMKPQPKPEQPGYTPLSWAAKNGHKEIIRQLLKVRKISEGICGVFNSAKKMKKIKTAYFIN